MLEKEFTDSCNASAGGGGELSRKNKHTLARHPILSDVGGSVRDLLIQTRGLQRVLKYIDKSENPQIPLILEGIAHLQCAPLMLEFLPLLEQIYRLDDTTDLSWIDEYGYLFERSPVSPITCEQLMSLVRMKQIIQGKILHAQEQVHTPADFVDSHLQEYMYNVSHPQLVGCFLVLELLHRRTPYIEGILTQYAGRIDELFAQVEPVTFDEKCPVRHAVQKGPFLQFYVSRSAMTTLGTKMTRALFHDDAHNKTIRHAITLLENYEGSTEKHEQQHHTTAWNALETVSCVSRDWYFGTKDEILAFMAGADRNFQSIFRTLFVWSNYDPYIEMQHDTYSYDYWRNDYRKKLLLGLMCASLLEKKIGRQDAIDALNLIHFRSWKSELKRLFDIVVPPLDGKEKDILKMMDSPASV